MAQRITWSDEQRRAIQQAIADFKRYIGTEAYQAALRDREGRKTFFQHDLPERLGQLSDADVEEIVGLLWAHQMWGNKTYIAQKIVEENGLEHLQQSLRMLYELQADPEEAYERFLSAVKRWGPASVTEMLAYIYPERCGIWNKQARTALQVLGLSDKIDVKKYSLSKSEYHHFNELLRALAEELRQAGIGDVDLLMVDFFLYHVATTRSAEDVAHRVQAVGGFDHDEIRDLIAGIGAYLGFDTDIEVQIARGARVDVVWRARIANLGMVTYVFEVHRSGSIDSLILNLLKASNIPTVQKVIAVSDSEQLRQIEKECEGLENESFRRALRFWDVRDVVETHAALEKAMTRIANLGLLEEKA